ncbi:uncharacterized protein LOC135330924 [Halichondria panicea]|uniref:uncharacterized protein LOC135330924 n=1 Tax=Halichondria panicea TaxID=6063 RepID=UPI00312B77C1
MEPISLHQEITKALGSQNGILFSSPAIVHRAMYTGRGIIAPNTQFIPEMVDERGSLPVEWWIMSKTEAKNAIPVKDEGITSLLIGDQLVSLPTALRVAEKELMGDYAALWPLTKILDIGGVKRQPNLTPELNERSTEETEVPPIPCHVHAGDVVDGCCMGHGKTEAYFFPPLDVPPYNMELGPVKTRLGLRPDVTKDKVLSSLRHFGENDNLYPLLNEYQIRPWESWTIEQKIIHAPGPWLTFEIQLPQDDFHLLAWVLGERIASEELEEARKTYHLRGLESDEKLLDETLDWAGNTDPSFKERWWRECEVLQKGDWGKVVRLFYHGFYGEGFVVHPGAKYQREGEERPFAGIVWSGEGRANSLAVSCQEKLRREFLVTPNNQLQLENTSHAHDLIVFTVFPLLKPAHS